MQRWIRNDKLLLEFIQECWGKKITISGQKYLIQTNGFKVEENESALISYGPSNRAYHKM